MKLKLSLLICLLALASPELLIADIDTPQGIIILDGRTAPDLKLEDIDGNVYDIHQSRGKWVFVHFWAAWCGPCRREMPTVQRMSELLKDDSIDIVLVNTAETEDVIFNFMGVVAPDMSTLMDRDGLVTELWQPRGLPASFFVSPNGTLEYIALGGREWDKPKFLNFVKQVIKSRK